MSLGEFLIILIIGVLVLSPEDIRFLLVNFYKLRKYLLDITDQFTAPLRQEIEELEQAAEMDFYLRKIFELGSRYEGEYNLGKIKACYYKILKSKKSDYH